MSRLKRPRDPNQLAHLIVQIATGAVEDNAPEKQRNAKFGALSDLGAAKGGHARAKSLSSRKRQAIAKAAAKARWSKK
jgi:hypothetical protein